MTRRTGGWGQIALTNSPIQKDLTAICPQRVAQVVLNNLGEARSINTTKLIKTGVQVVGHTPVPRLWLA